MKVWVEVLTHAFVILEFSFESKLLQHQVLYVQLLKLLKHFRGVIDGIMVNLCTYLIWDPIVGQFPFF